MPAMKPIMMIQIMFDTVISPLAFACNRADETCKDSLSSDAPTPSLAYHDDSIECLKRLIKGVERKLFLIVDRGSAHREESQRFRANAG
jgi:hypothetical protein